MADMMINLALRRKLAAAEVAGDSDRVERIRARLAAPGEAPKPQAVAEPAAVAPEGLDAVEFASPAARAAADAAGMTVESFKRRRRSSEGGFTKADVERIAGGTDED